MARWTQSWWADLILSSVGLGRDQPFPSDAAGLARLAAAQRAYIEDRTLGLAWPVYAHNQPVADRSQGRRLLYTTDAYDSAPVTLNLAGPSLLVGLEFVATIGDDEEALLLPLELFDVKVELGTSQVSLAVREDVPSGAASVTSPTGFLPAATQNISRKLIMREFPEQKPSITVTVRGRFASNGSPPSSGFGDDATIDIIAHTIRLDRQVL